jgi:hypothetical protein
MERWFINSFALWHRNQARNGHKSTESSLNKCEEQMCLAYALL